MRDVFKKITAFMIVFAMIMSLGVSAYTEEANITEDPPSSNELEEVSDGSEDTEVPPVSPEDTEDLGEPEDPGEAEVPEAPEDPVTPENPVDPEETDTPGEPEDPGESVINPEDPATPVDPEETDTPGEPVDSDIPIDTDVPVVSEIPEVPIVLPIEALTYTVRYYVDEIEEVDWEIIGEVPMDKPLVEEVPHLNMPEGYIVDEESSTVLPFEVSEENNVIEVYYVSEFMLLRLVPGGMEYPADTEVLPLRMVSTNDNTEALFTWMHEGDIYLALISHDYLTSVTYNGYSVPISTVERASGRDDHLIIDDIDYGILDQYARKAHKQHHRWSVVRISGETLTSPFEISATTNLGKGHDLTGVTVHVEIEGVLEVYHQYDGGAPILDVEQSGSIYSPFEYEVYPVYDGYELQRIAIRHNGAAQPDGVLDPDDILRGTVPLDEDEASAIITFIYELPANGEITITKELLNGNSEDDNREFDIFIYGPGGSVYVVTLTPGESKTITGLAYGEYTIEEIVPMNFSLIDIENEIIELTKNDFIESTTVINKRDNDGWFYDDDERENKFTVSVTTASREFVLPKKVVEII